MGDLGWPPVGQGIGDRGFEPGWDGQEFVFGQFRCYLFLFLPSLPLSAPICRQFVLTHNVDDRDSVAFLLSFRRTAQDSSRVVSKLLVANSSVPWLDHTPPLTFFMTLYRTLKRLKTNKASDECGLVAELLHFAPDNTISWQLSWTSWIKFCTQGKFHRVGQKLCSRRFQKQRTHEPRRTSGPLLISDSCTKHLHTWSWGASRSCWNMLNLKNSISERNGWSRRTTDTIMSHRTQQLAPPFQQANRAAGSDQSCHLVQSTHPFRFFVSTTSRTSTSSILLHTNDRAFQAFQITIF